MNRVVVVVRVLAYVPPGSSLFLQHARRKIEQVLVTQLTLSGCVRANACVQHFRLPLLFLADLQALCLKHRPFIPVLCLSTTQLQRSAGCLPMGLHQVHVQPRWGTADHHAPARPNFSHGPHAYSCKLSFAGWVSFMLHGTAGGESPLLISARTLLSIALLLHPALSPA